MTSSSDFVASGASQINIRTLLEESGQSFPGSAVEFPVVREEPNTLLAIEVASIDIAFPPVE
jgi:hypothetical protein